MTAEVINTDWFLGQDPPEGTVSILGKSGQTIDAFSYAENFAVGESLEVEFTSLDGDIAWDEMFSGNPKKEKKLLKIDNWTYEAYGQIISINPVCIDFGDIELETSNWTNDEAVVGEFLYWKIDRLDISRK